MAQTETTAKSKTIRVRPRASGADKGVPQVASELWTLTVGYAKQEIRDPVVALKSYLAYGIPAMILTGLGSVLLALGLLRFLQNETGSTFTGNWSWAPYGIVLLAAAVVIAIVRALVMRRARK